MGSLRSAVRPLADKAITAVVARVAARDVTTELLYGPDGRLNDRMLTREQLDELVRQVRETTRVPDALSQVAQAYRMLVDLEARCVGRIAGTTSNILGKLVAAPLLLRRREKPVRVLEIGTLFGVFAAGLHKQLLRHGHVHDLVIVDPLESVQLQPERERATDPSGTPVTLGTLHANLRFGGVDLERVRVERGLSTEDSVRDAVGEGFDVIVIDGDHSREGVAKDLAWAERIASPGAVVVMDDYGDPGWPGVRDALDAHLSGESRFVVRGVVSTSAFLVAR
ncbi:class I SAM-dependent methyltransferase [Amycolatopsis acidicola]|uniref:Class I SAM-dependent methyltransferase n=1 Tax=Amycolatopsis acidicola TaxID=2596893 RepID=A0A5N0UJH6_9PSEU|nr:class I SAM-dependent methyltransferase [Amycolatopsis acidicola]KAA9148875.1 class I SAM-dependent methyltransferase [Amycolatopsis acidicola]